MVGSNRNFQYYEEINEASPSSICKFALDFPIINPVGWLQCLTSIFLSAKEWKFMLEVLKH